MSQTIKVDEWAVGNAVAELAENLPAVLEAEDWDKVEAYADTIRRIARAYTTPGAQDD